LLNETAVEASKVEHCQDLNDFFEQIFELTEGVLIKLGQAQGNLDETLQTYQAELDELLETGLPLSARGTPAFNDCCMCSLLERRVKAWLGLELTNRAQCDSQNNSFISCCRLDLLIECRNFTGYRSLSQLHTGWWFCSSNQVVIS
jgi:hypothetical protein